MEVLYHLYSWLDGVPMTMDGSSQHKHDCGIHSREFVLSFMKQMRKVYPDIHFSFDVVSDE